MNDLAYSEILAKLRHDIREAESEASRLQVRLDDVNSRLTDMQRAAESIARLIGECLSEVSRSEDVIGSEPKSPIRHADVAERILREAGTALRVPEIATRMMMAGHPLPDDERIRNSAVYSALVRRPNVFVRASRGNWGLKEWPHPQSVAHRSIFEDKAEATPAQETE